MVGEVGDVIIMEHLTNPGVTPAPSKMPDCGFDFLNDIPVLSTMVGLCNNVSYHKLVNKVIPIAICRQ